MCENCGSTNVRWVVIDDNMECEMCAKCVKLLRKEMDIKYINND